LQYCCDTTKEFVVPSDIHVTLQILTVLIGINDDEDDAINNDQEYAEE